MAMRYLFCLSMILLSMWSLSQQPLIANISSRRTISLNGKWQYIVDPYETGFYNYRWTERNENDREAYWSSDVPENKTDRKEHGYSDKYTLKVPGDWNSQDPKFLYYEGAVWYKKAFDFQKPNSGDRVFLYFGAVNYRADVYLNGKKLGMHKGGFTPFNFEIPDSILKTKGNFLVVKVDNKRDKDEVPTLNTDWWNYGGITREVKLVILPQAFIQDYSIQLVKSPVDANDRKVEGWVKFGGSVKTDVGLEIPEIKFKKQFIVTGDSVSFHFEINGLQLWSPENPKLYRVIIISGHDRVEDKIGFRSIEVKGKQILLNGKPLFLRGICIHEEIPQRIGRAWSKQDALQLLGGAKQLFANMVRLAHYPHNENMARIADSLGLLVWSEIPVYWTIDFSSAEVFQKAKQQLTEMIARDHNRASVVIWSVGNETPVNETRTEFMRNLIVGTRELDGTRLVSAALQSHSQNNVNIIDDPLGQYVDLVSINEYLGWYSGLPNVCRTATWEVRYDKPLFFSETGAEALSGFHGDSLTRWSEEYQEWCYKEQIEMMKRMPDNFVGLSPWILNDFRSPRRNNPVYQEGWNNKGLFDHKGKKKKAFYVLREYYQKLEKQH